VHEIEVTFRQLVSYFKYFVFVKIWRKLLSQLAQLLPGLRGDIAVAPIRRLWEARSVKHGYPEMLGDLLKAHPRSEQLSNN
jgi:hypothetical protein